MIFPRATPMFLNVALLQMARASPSSNVVPMTNTNDRQLGLMQDWALSLESTVPVEGTPNAIALTFRHGNGGIPNYEIYAKENFDASADPTGETCLSQGGTLMDADTAGLSPFLSDQPVTLAPDADEYSYSQSVATIELDKTVLPMEFMNDSKTVVQYCVRFFLANEAGEKCVTLETEIRIEEGVDGSISLQQMGVERTAPLVETFSTTVRAEATICQAPQGQGDIVSICINGPENMNVAVDAVTSFNFFTIDENGDALGTSQLAFIDGQPASLSEVVPMEDGSFKFNTLLNAEFYTGTMATVTGEGTVSLSIGGNSGRRGLEEEEEYPVQLMFVIKGDGSVTALDDGAPQTYVQSSQWRNKVKALSNNEESSANSLSIVLFVLATVFSVSALAFVAYNLYQKKQLQQNTPKVVTKKSTMDDDLFRNEDVTSCRLSDDSEFHCRRLGENPMNC